MSKQPSPPVGARWHHRPSRRLKQDHPYRRVNCWVAAKRGAMVLSIATPHGRPSALGPHAVAPTAVLAGRSHQRHRCHPCLHGHHLHHRSGHYQLRGVSSGLSSLSYTSQRQAGAASSASLKTRCRGSFRQTNQAWSSASVGTGCAGQIGNARSCYDHQGHTFGRSIENANGIAGAENDHISFHICLMYCPILSVNGVHSN